jgi:hypothetical protein
MPYWRAMFDYGNADLTLSVSLAYEVGKMLGYGQLINICEFDDDHNIAHIWVKKTVDLPKDFKLKFASRAACANPAQVRRKLWCEENYSKVPGKTIGTQNCELAQSYGVAQFLCTYGAQHSR